MAFAAVQGTVPPLAWLLFLGNLLWTTGYDTWYAMVDRDDDIRIGIRTSAITFGRFDVLMVMLSYLAFLGILAGLGLWIKAGPWFFGGLLVAAAMAGYHYTLIRQRDRAGCFAAFMHNNWLGAAVFAGIVLDHGFRLNAWPLWSGG